MAEEHGIVSLGAHNEREELGAADVHAAVGNLVHAIGHYGLRRVVVGVYAFDTRFRRGTQHHRHALLLLGHDAFDAGIGLSEDGKKQDNLCGE